MMNEENTTRLVVCVNQRFGPGQKSCGGSGSRDLIVALRQQLDRLKQDFEVQEQVCLGRCQQGIACRIAPGGPFFTEVTQKDIPTIIHALQHFKPPV